MNGVQIQRVSHRQRIEGVARHEPIVRPVRLVGALQDADPLRVAENAAVLDMLSKGRLRLGLGRGLARREFNAFRLSMDESRGRFDEAAPMIGEALRTGFMEGDGKYYKQPRIEIRPRPQHSFDGRIYAVASSEDSIDSAAKLGAHMVMFADRPWEMREVRTKGWRRAKSASTFSSRSARTRATAGLPEADEAALASFGWRIPAMQVATRGHPGERATGHRMRRPWDSRRYGFAWVSW